MIGILEVGLESNDGLLSHFFHLSLKVSNVFSFGDQVFQNSGVKLL